VKVQKVKVLCYFYFVLWVTVSPSSASKLCGVEFVSPQQLKQVVSDKTGQPANLNDPQYETYFDSSAAVAWAFTTQKNPAHPSVVCRKIVPKGKEVVVKLEARCGNTKSSCDAMMETWNQLNQRMLKELKSK
jgi:hypothetical protein